MKLFTIGDSISQGFMSGAAARTDLSYPTILAKVLHGVDPAAPTIPEYRHPKWPAGGMPFNLERIMRRLNRRYGSGISGFEWLTVLQSINDVIDEAEDYYERGAGAADLPYPEEVDFFHNVSVRGFTVADSWQLTPTICQTAIRDAKGSGDAFMSGPNAPFFRTALKVLNPSLKASNSDRSQLDWLDLCVKRPGGVENLIVWLGSNNALGTIVSLAVNQTPGPLARNAGEDFAKIPYLERERAAWNLWHPDDFEQDYRELANRLGSAMKVNKAKDWRVFIGNVPQVTIAPLAKGVGDTFEVDLEIEGRKVKQVYYKYYTYFPFSEATARETGLHIAMEQAVLIDRCIIRYNEIIKQQIQRLNKDAGEDRFHLVDSAKMLRDIAFKRNRGAPPYKFPAVFEFQSPPVNTKYYHADERGVLKQGGLFTLDGIHPSGIAHGLIALEFLRAMEAAGRQVNVASIEGAGADAQKFWRAVFQNDQLYSAPISLMKEIYQHDRLAKHLIKLIRLMAAYIPSAKFLD